MKHASLIILSYNRKASLQMCSLFHSFVTFEAAWIELASSLHCGILQKREQIAWDQRPRRSNAVFQGFTLLKRFKFGGDWGPAPWEITQRSYKRLIQRHQFYLPVYSCFRLPFTPDQRPGFKSPWESSLIINHPLWEIKSELVLWSCREFKKCLIYI